jgi:putative salt-induced outer membrane protein YdiY
MVGTMAPAGEEIVIRTAESLTLRIGKDQIQTIRSLAEQTAFEARMERLQNPRLIDFWSGSLDSGLSSTRGNAETITLNLATRAAHTTERNRASFYITSLLARSGISTGKSNTTANTLRAGARYDLKVKNRLFAFGFSDFDLDRVQGLDLRRVLGGGLGFNAQKTKRAVLEFFGGGSFNQEFFEDGLERGSGEMLAREEHSRKLFDWGNLEERFAFYGNLSDLGEYRMALDASATVRLNNWLSWHFTLSDRFISNPPADKGLQFSPWRSTAGRPQEPRTYFLGKSES